jgi:nanoRNase/pAp phosphatase (c-di-AMP/oligoRNAs hydrolase)
MEISKDKISFHRAGLNTDLIFIVQTQNFSLLNNFFTKEQEMFSKVPVINVDNSIENENFGKINLVSPIFGSISELCAELVLELGIKLEKDAATNLLTGIDYCTKNLADNVRPETLEIAAWCLKNGGVRLWKTRIPQDQQNKDVLHKVLKIEDEKKETPPNDVPSPDWLQPKIYHGSTLL